tara:strand:+ start:12481 stop:13173 length:693 start_codon:yes stop_codon:yes gene_type:complete
MEIITNNRWARLKEEPFMAVLKDMQAMLKRTFYLLIIFSLVVIIPPSDSFPNGVGKAGSNGCLCHGGNSDLTSLEIEGLPDKFESNTTYDLRLIITSEIDIASENSSKGGFRINISHGVINFENDSHGTFLEDSWTHTEEGNKYRTWNFSWTSPEDNSSSVEFRIYGNAVNGNGNPYGDAWNYLDFKIGGVEYFDDLSVREKDYQIQTYEAIILAVVSLGLIYAAFKAVK